MIAQRDLWTPRTWTREERDFLLAFVDDTEESPWMVTTDLQQQVIDAFRFPLRHYAAKYHPEWYISTDLAVAFPKPDGSMGQVAPDVLVTVAENWRLPRMAVVDRNVLRLGVFELLDPVDATPPAVAINEAIELARRYGSADSPAFVNGILDNCKLKIEERKLNPPAEEPKVDVSAAPPPEPDPQPEV